MGAGPAGGQAGPRTHACERPHTQRAVPLISGHQRPAAAGHNTPRIIYGQGQDNRAHSSWPSPRHLPPGTTNKVTGWRPDDAPLMFLGLCRHGVLLGLVCRAVACCCVTSCQQAQMKMAMAVRLIAPTKARPLMIQCMRCVLLIRMVWWSVRVCVVGAAANAGLRGWWCDCIGPAEAGSAVSLHRPCGSRTIPASRRGPRWLSVRFRHDQDHLQPVPHSPGAPGIGHGGQDLHQARLAPSNTPTTWVGAGGAVGCISHS